MTLTHVQVIEEAEKRLINALISRNRKELIKTIHPEVVFTDESGQTFVGIENIPYLNSDILQLESSEITNCSIAFFTNIAIVNCIEHRRGKYLGLCFERSFRISRSWKFGGRHWQLISASLVLLPEKESDLELHP